jgi:hypothetical protein
MVNQCNILPWFKIELVLFAIQVSCGGTHSVALTRDGQMFSVSISSSFYSNGNDMIYGWSAVFVHHRG